MKTKGFSRHTIAEFNTYNDTATVKVKDATKDNTIQRYTYSIPDADPNYCWMRHEDVYTKLMTIAEKQKIYDEQGAVNLGMIMEGYSKINIWENTIFKANI